jgi:dihydroorotase
MRIDPHVHFRDEAQAYKETIAHGLKVAESQGVGMVFDMPNTVLPVLREADVERRLKLVPKEAKCGYKVYIGATADKEQLLEAARLAIERDEVAGIKLFAGKSTGDLAIISEAEQHLVYETLADYSGVLAVHCEKEAFMHDSFDPKQPITHTESRPKQAELESVKDQLAFAGEAGFKGNLHVCHASCAETVRLVRSARIKASCGVTPHHLLWDDSALCGEHGLLYKMNPPLRAKEAVEELRECVKKGEVDWIETDHAPHAIGEKLHAGYPSGYPSLYLYARLVDEFLPSLGLSEELVRKMTFDNINKAFDLGL